MKQSAQTFSKICHITRFWLHPVIGLCWAGNLDNGPDGVGRGGGRGRLRPQGERGGGTATRNLIDTCTWKRGPIHRGFEL